MAEGSELVTLNEILATAEADGLGTQASLRRRFYEYQSKGLVGTSVGRTARRGGEGLWHPVHRALFFDLVHLRQEEGLRLPTLANLPMALWRIRTPGIEVEQVQRVLGYWGGFVVGAPSDLGQSGELRHESRSRGERRPRGDRSLRRQAIQTRVDELSGPGASDASKRSLRDLLDIVNDTGDLPSPDTLQGRVLEALNGPEDPSPEARLISVNQYKSMAVIILAVRHLDDLIQPDAQPLWEWARRVDEGGRAEYLDRQFQLVSDPELGHLFTQPLFIEILQQACLGMTTILGMGLAIQWRRFGFASPEGHEPPPPVKITQRW